MSTSFTVVYVLISFFLLSFCADSIENNDLLHDETDRSGKFFPFFLGPQVIRVDHSSCTGDNGLAGTCQIYNDCVSSGGKPSGTCSNGFGRCCVVQKTCGMSTASNCTYFTSPGYPVPCNSVSSCKLTIWRCAPDVCQLRLDFLDFNLAEPDANGTCKNDFLMVTGGNTNVPRICGVNTGEHVYVDFNGGAPIMLMIDTSSALPQSRSWNIKITQVKCCDRAPVGCLMDYKATSGQVKSFNYSPAKSTAVAPPTDPGTRELANLNYGVCVEMAPGYCSIEWSQCPGDPYSFTVSGNTDLIDPSLLGTPAVSEVGADCIHDYVIIPNPMVTPGMSLPYDRFCGNGFPTVTTSSKPFVLTVVTDAGEIEPPSSDFANRGFCLNYRQLPCS